MSARRLVAALGLAVALPAAAGPVGQRLPSVRGTSLAGAEVRLPEDLAGAPAVLLVAYRRQTQADVDRWLAALDRLAPDVVALEVPTITNPIWRPLQGWIDDGMRGGVPAEAWGRVVTLYDEAPRLADFLGERRGAVTHVVLLDATGTVAFFHAEGYSEEAAARLIEAVGALGAGS